MKAFIITQKGKDRLYDKLADDLESSQYIQPNKIKRIYIDMLDTCDLKKVTSPACYNFCSPEFISRWLSHCRVWEKIINEEGDKFLILEDETTISNNFIELVNKLRGRDNDIIYLGCKDDTCKFTDSLHGYIVSKNGAKKMVELHNTNKIPFLLNYIDRNLDIYRGPELVFKNVDMMRLKKESVHPLITFFAGILGLSNTTLLNFNSDILYFRKFDYGITYLSIYLLLPSLIAGLLGQKISLCYLITLIIAFIAELIIWNRTNDYQKIKVMLTELVLIIFVILIGRGINHKIMGLFRAQQSENVELPSS